MRRSIAWAVLLVAGLVWQTQATENGGGAYPNGAEGLMSGALPPPGHYLVNYVLYYHADKLMDGNGDEMPVDFEANLWADVVRLINVTPIQVLGASWAQQVFVPVVNLDLTTPGGKDDTTALGDIIVDPIVLGWHMAPWHCIVGLDIYLPTGEYDKDNIANVGRNVWTFEPAAAVTWLNNDGCEVSAKLMYDINTKNDDTDYQSGDEIHADFVAAKHFGNFAVGVGGFYYEQVTDDDGLINTPAGPVEASSMDGNKGKQVALGPQLSCNCGGLSLILASDHEFATENKTEGDRYWFKLIASF